MRWGWLFVGLAVVAGSWPVWAWAQGPKPAGTGGPPASKTNADDAGVREAARAFVAAFNAGDAKALAALYATDARMREVDGCTLEGRAAIEQEYAGLFQAHPGATMAVTTEAVRLLGPGLAVEEGTNRVTPKGGEGTPWGNRHSVVYIRRDGRWLIADEHESPAEEPARRDRIKELDWLLGDWVNESEDAVVHTSCRLSPDGTSLLREHRVEVGGKTMMSGAQRIGWDDPTKQFKSWEFDSEGGRGESVWARAGAKGWVIKAQGMQPDGRVVTATHHVRAERVDRIQWKSVDRTVGDVALPDPDEYVLVRRPPGPKHEATATPRRPQP